MNGAASQNHAENGGVLRGISLGSVIWVNIAERLGGSGGIGWIGRYAFAWAGGYSAITGCSDCKESTMRLVSTTFYGLAVFSLLALPSFGQGYYGQQAGYAQP